MYIYIYIYMYVYICMYIYIYTYIYNVATYKTIKRTELTTVKLPLSFETNNLFNIIGWVGRS